MIMIYYCYKIGFYCNNISAGGRISATKRSVSDDSNGLPEWPWLAACHSPPRGCPSLHTRLLAALGLDVAAGRRHLLWLQMADMAAGFGQRRADLASCR